jgi:hypothetical protein
MCEGMPINKSNLVPVKVDDNHKNKSWVYKINRMLEDGRQLSRG